jgi:hypothetical protein
MNIITKKLFHETYRKTMLQIKADIETNVEKKGPATEEEEELCDK